MPYRAVFSLHFLKKVKLYLHFCKDIRKITFIAFYFWNVKFYF